MKKQIWVKFLVLALCAGLLLGACLSGVGILVLSSEDLYDTYLPAYLESQNQDSLLRAANLLLGRYASGQHGKCPDNFLESYYGSNFDGYLRDGCWGYTIQEYPSGDILQDVTELFPGNNLREDPECTTYTFAPNQLTGFYYQCLGTTPESELGDHFGEGLVRPDATEDSELPYRTWIFYDPSIGQDVGYQVVTQPMPQYAVTLYVGSNGLANQGALELLLTLWGLRYHLFWILGLCLAGFAASLVFLCSVAGSRPEDDTPRPGGLNLLPLDLYAVLDGLLGFFCIYVVLYLGNALDFPNQNLHSFAMIAITVAYFLLVIVVGYLYALAAQVRAGNGYWWRHSLTAITIRGAWHTLLWCLSHGLILLRRLWHGGEALLTLVSEAIVGILRACWHGLSRGCSWLGHQVNRLYTLLPLTWQWILTGVIMLLLLVFSVLIQSEGFLVLALLFYFAMILYGATAFGILLAGARAMSQGDLEQKVDSRFLIGAFRDFSDSLNDLAGVAVIAAQKQMKSERMKTELITNISHDIKTPLTSIINYVDLLQKDPTDEEARQYLEVLARQSQRMKKLVEDLMEMSKATTGNLTVDIRQVDAREAVTQALGEFSDKLHAAGLTPVFPEPQDPVMIRADGRLCWRVLSNLLSNAVKYALPGTRVYADISRQGDTVHISLKNISRESLNMGAEELMERFVRGDTARNTEGSGLGLNIAKSLMEVQHGKLALVVAGDLFKATLIFPAA